MERWTARWGGMWIILLKSSSDEAWAWSGMEPDAAEQSFAAAYPSLHRHFRGFEPALRQREDHGTNWWELRPCSYYSAFDRAKIVYPEITWRPQFAFDRTGLVCNNTAYVLPAEEIGLLAAEIKDCERHAGEAVNAAYGLTAQEARLIWETAPPRMPGE